MSSLFLDTSDKVVFGALDEELNWLFFRSAQDRKASKSLHALIYQSLQEIGLELADIKDVFYISGPGSYTGVRVARGFAELVEWQGAKSYACRHFDVPALLGHDEGLFVAQAYKQEVFTRRWSGESFEQELVAQLRIEELLSSTSLPVYTSEPEIFGDALSTHSMIEQRPAKLFGAMRSRRLKTDVFYYRELDEEFSKGKR